MVTSVREAQVGTPQQYTIHHEAIAVHTAPKTIQLTPRTLHVFAQYDGAATVDTTGIARPPSMAQLESLYISSLFGTAFPFWLAHQWRHPAALTPVRLSGVEYSLYTDDAQQQAFALFSDILHQAGRLSLYDQGVLVYWLFKQSFNIHHKLAPPEQQAQRSTKQRGVRNPEKRQKIWDDPFLLELFVTTMLHMENAQFAGEVWQPDFSQDRVGLNMTHQVNVQYPSTAGSPAGLQSSSYIRNDQVWYRPAHPRKSQEQHIVALNHTYSPHPVPERDDTTADFATRILRAASAYATATQLLAKNHPDKIATPATTGLGVLSISIFHLRQLAEEVQLLERFPTPEPKHSQPIPERDVSLSHSQVSEGSEYLEWVTAYLSDPFQKNRFDQFLKKQNWWGKQLTPKFRPPTKDTITIPRFQGTLGIE